MIKYRKCHRSLKFTVKGDPVPQGRPRATRIGNKITMYDPKKSRDYKKLVSTSVDSQYKGEPLQNALEMTIDIYRFIPKSTTKKNRGLIENNLYRPIVKPDVTNIAKGVEDALNGILYKDDSQIVDLRIRKYYSDNPRIEIEVKELCEQGSTWCYCYPQQL